MDITNRNNISKQCFVNPLNNEEETIITDNRIFYVYVLFKDNTPIYVGKTTNIKQRIASHISTGRKFDSYQVAFDCVGYSTCNIVEKTLISYLKFLYPALENKNSVEMCGVINTLKSFI